MLEESQLDGISFAATNQAVWVGMARHKTIIFKNKYFDAT
jgi:hypothetical protein